MGTAAATPGPASLSSEILFERDGEIQALDLGSGRTRPLTHDLPDRAGMDLGDPWALSPDGQWLALAHNPEGQAALLALVPPAGGPAQEVGRFEGRIDVLCWSHDATRLLFLLNRRHERTGELLEQSLRLYDTVSRGQAVLYQRTFRAEEASRHGLWPWAWVPGNAAIYVVYALDRTNDPGTLHVLDVRGGEPRPVTTDFLPVGGQAVWAESSQLLLRPRLAERGLSPLYLARASLDGSLSEIRRLTPGDWFVGAVAWSPDGRQVVVERHEAQAHGTFVVHLWSVALDGTARQLTSAPAYREEHPVWAPDGRTIVFERWRATRPEPAGLWALDLDQAEPRRIEEVGLHPQAACCTAGAPGRSP